MSLLKGNCLETLKTLETASVDSIVTDPPYELGFMGKSWDNSGIAYNVELWAECLRVLKPGGHLLAFGGSRTYHRLASAVEDSGFEIRDQIMWLYGNGFPKSHNIEKAINKIDGVEFIKKPASGVGFMNAEGIGGYNTTINQLEQVGDSSERAQQWKGWGTALKPAHEPIVVARKPFEGTVANNVLTYGTGAINIDATRVSGEKGDGNWKGVSNNSAKDQIYAGGWDGSVQGQEPITTDGFIGRWPANIILTHSPDCRQVGVQNEQVPINRTEDWTVFGQVERPDYKQSISDVPTPVWHCVEGCPTLGFPESKSPKPYNPDPDPAKNGMFGGLGGVNHGTKFGDSVSAARFFTQTAYDEIDFPPFIYQAKANSRERSEGLDDLETKQTVGGGGMTNVGDKYGSIKAPAKNFHPTVKPVALMQHLIRLVTPAGGKVLDPFLGSGTTAVAAILEGCDWVGCEITPDYWQIIETRVLWAEKKVGENVTLF